MATSNYTIAPPSVAPLLHEYGDFDRIPEEAWDEYCAAQAYWARSRRMYTGQGEGRKARRQNETTLSAGTPRPSKTGNELPRDEKGAGPKSDPID